MTPGTAGHPGIGGLGVTNPSSMVNSSIGNLKPIKLQKNQISFNMQASQASPAKLEIPLHVFFKQTSMNDSSAT